MDERGEKEGRREATTVTYCGTITHNLLLVILMCRFEKQMKNMMAENHGKNPLAMEMALRAKIGNSTVHVENEGEQTFEGAGTAEYVEEVEETEEGAKKQSAFRMAQELAALKVTGRDDGHVTEVEEEEGWGELVKPVGEGGEGGEDPSMVVANWKEMNDDNGHYFWNTVTNDTSYDEPPCMVVARTGIEWQKVDDDGSGNSYYWNVVTNDTSYEPPTGFKEAGGREGAIRGSGGAAVEEEEEGEAIMWTEYVNKEGKRMYQQSDKPEVTREDKPDGAVLVACEDESMWSEALGEDGSVSYTNAVSGEVRTEKPDGVIMVAEVKGGGWQVHQDGEGNEYYYNAGTGKSQYEKPEDM